VKQRHLGRSGLIVSRLALGTMTWGGDTDEDDAAAQLVAFRDAGGTLVDTADVYVGGESERVLGRLLADVVPRDEMLIATKAVSPMGKLPMMRGGSRGHLLSALDASLRRLQTDYIDLWQLHSFDLLTPWEETMAALDAAVSSGKVRYVGVSNYGGWQLGACAAWQRAVPGRAPIVSSQMEYSLLQRDIERELLPMAESLGLGVLAWSPLGGGVLSGKYTGSPDRSSATRLDPSTVDEHARAVATVVSEVAGELGATPSQVAIAWTMARSRAVHPMLGARRVEQLRDNLGALDVVLPAEALARLDAATGFTAGFPTDFIRDTSGWVFGAALVDP
jgi:aryl-alcohol dehydrogenase-like predicted oxidoreductase